MTENIIISLVGAIINMLLALLLPCLLRKTNISLLDNIKKVYSTHKQLIITSSVIVFITIYLALTLTPDLNLSEDNDNSFIDLSEIFKRPFENNDTMNVNGYSIINLSKL